MIKTSPVERYHILTANNCADLLKENHPTTIEEYIKAGISLVKSAQCYQALIAYYALSVCIIRHGGISNNIYTLKNYADDIGVPVKTLQNWTLIYRKVVIHLGIDPKDITKEDWCKATKIAYNDEARNRSDNIQNGFSRKRDEYKEQKSGRSPQEIKRAFENFDETQCEVDVNNWNYQIMQIKNKLILRDLKLADKKTLEELMSHCDKISDHINDFLTEAKKHGNRSYKLNQKNTHSFM